jgi:hypothetical protein
MHLKLTTWITLTVCGLAAGCSGVNVRIERERWPSDAGLRYAWRDSQTSEPVREALGAPWLDGFLHETIDETLTAKGYRQARRESADLLVRYFVLVDTEADSITLDSYDQYQTARQVRGGYFWPYPAVTPEGRMTIYKEATLVVSVQGAGGSGGWRGVAAIELDDTPDARRDQFRRAIEDMLSHAPAAGS